MMSQHLKDLKKSKVPDQVSVVQLAPPTVHAGKHVNFSPLLANTYRGCPDCFPIEAKAGAGSGAGTGPSGGRDRQHWDTCCTHIKSFSFQPN